MLGRRTNLLPLLLLLFGCGRLPTPADANWIVPLKLSEYGLFRDGPAQEPADGVLPYDLNTPLFSDYATKLRFVRMPPGTSATYHESDVFSFPVGTVLVKTFAYPHDLKDPAKGRQLIETRLLVHRPEGWTGLPYMWNQEQTDATLRVGGGRTMVRWRHTDGGERSLEYFVPNFNQCLTCHEQQRVMGPIGPKARHLNKGFAYANGHANQLDHWATAGILRGIPSGDAAPQAPVWNDPSTGTLDQRARAWLDINCAHCHNPAGSAKQSGLDLRVQQANPARWGVWKSPVAAGRGSGGRSFDIVPGKPDDSILLYRLQSTEPGVLMPELSRRLVDEEGIVLIRDWIAALPAAATPNR